MTSPDSSTLVTRNDDEQRYELTVSGELAGIVAYRDQGGARDLHHTEIFPAFGGKGLGRVLVEAAVADVSDSGLQLVASCPFVAKVVGEQGQPV